MKITISIPWFRPAYKAGGPIQSVANMVEEDVCSEEVLRSAQDDRLVEENLKFSIFCGNKDLDGSVLQGVDDDHWTSYNSNTTVWYSSNNYILAILKKEIKKEKPSHLYIVGIYDWQYNVKPLLFCKDVKKIVSVRGMLHPGALSQKAFKKRIYLALWKMMGLHKRVIFHATDAEEKKYIESVFSSRVTVKIAANFPRVFGLQPVVQKESGKLKLVSVALISPMKNILLVLEALKEVGSRPKTIGGGMQEESMLIEYNIYGPVKDKQYWNDCLACIKKLPANISVNYYGDIHPDKIEAALAASHVFILPSKSENYGHSIIEALYAGRPVITSNNTPWNELESAKAGINISLDDKAQLINVIQRFAAMNQGELELWSKCARAYADKAVDMDAIRKQYKELFS